MSVRPLPHFAHNPIGKTTHKRGFTYAHVNYITRDDACTKTLAGNMADTREAARPYFDREANKEGVPANARIADTFIIALPVELTTEQRHEAIASFMEKIGHGRIAWLAAFHDKGEDAHNPHCHLILRDADVETGRKVLGTTTSAKDVREAEAHGWRVPPRMTSKDLRVAWCEHLNAEMERHGYEARFDQRTLKEQGIDRKPQIHVGPKANAMSAKGKSFESQDRARGDHANVYSLLDAGSRAEHNDRIKRQNNERGQRGVDKLAQMTGREGVEKRELRSRQSDERKSLYTAQARDRAALRAAHEAQKLQHHRWTRKLYAEARQKAYEQTKADYADRWQEVWRTTSKSERAAAKSALTAEQRQAYRIASTKQIETVRPEKNAAWQSLKETQDKERNALKQRHVEETAALSRQHIAERHALHERWQQTHRDRSAAKASSRLSRQGMANANQTAVAMAKQHARQQKPAPRDLLDVPDHAAWQFRERARAAADSRAAIRYELDAMRRLNEGRAGPRAQRHMVAAHAAGQRFSATRTSQEQQQSDRQQGMQQALAGGRALTSEERAGATGAERSAVTESDKQRARRIREDSFRHFVEGQQQQRGRDRGGGRSER